MKPWNTNNEYKVKAHVNVFILLFFFSILFFFQFPAFPSPSLSLLSVCDNEEHDESNVIIVLCAVSRARIKQNKISLLHETTGVVFPFTKKHLALES